MTGSARQLTRNTNRQIWPALSPDGNLVAYQNLGQDGLMVDIATGKEKLIVPPGGGFLFPNFSSDGRRIAFSSSVRDPKTGEISYRLLVANLAGDPPEQVCADCGVAPVWSPDGRKLVWDIGSPRYIGITDVANKKSERLTSAAERGVIQPGFSPDGRWILAEMEHGADRANIVVAPYRDGAQIQPSDWAPLTEPSGFDSRPRWSPDGNRLYFVSDRDGFRCIWTTPLHPETKRSLGPAAAVAHFHEAKLSIPNVGSISTFGLSVGRDKLVFNLGEITGNIWLAE